MRRIVVFAVFLSLTLSSCDKYKNYKKATIIDTNNITGTGCGYIFQFADGTEQIPQYLPSAYQHGALKVKVKLSDLGSVVECYTDSITKMLPVVVVDDITHDLD